MKKILIAIFICSMPMWAFAQLSFSNNAVQDKPITNPALVIQQGSRTLEIMANLRALPLGSGKYQLMNSDAALSSNLYGVAYDHTQKAYTFLTGDISFKVANGSTLSSLPSTISLRSKLIASPNTYVLNVTTPTDIVTLLNLLKSSSAVEWTEVFTVQGVVN
jgi:hypothetical protein